MLDEISQETGTFCYRRNDKISNYTRNYNNCNTNRKFDKVQNCFIPNGISPTSRRSFVTIGLSNSITANISNI